MTSVPKTMRAVIIADEGKKVVLKEIPVPKLDDNDVLIKVEYASQNPTDWKHAFGIGNPNSITGCDLSGTIVSLGSNLNTARKIGDKVAFAVHGGLFPDKGAFAEYARAESDLVFEVPENLSMEGASNFGVPWVTALQAIADSQGHVWPPKETETGKWYLIYGASSSVGLFAIQVAKLYGYKIIAVCSPHNFDLVKSYGADEVVDYKNPEACSTRIKEISGGGVSIGLDTISEGTSFEIAMKGYAEKGGRLNAILPPKDEHRKIREDVEIVSTLMYTLFGKPFVFAGMDIPASEHDHEFGRAIAKHSTEVIKKHNIKPNPLKQLGGLEDIEAGLKHMQQGKVSGEKLVYKIAQ